VKEWLVTGMFDGEPDASAKSLISQIH
jgi:hypothetical protein